MRGSCGIDKKRSIMGKIQKRIYKTKLKIILIFSMTILISVILLIFSIILTHLTESKIRENVKDNMGIVVKNLDVNMNHFLKSMFEGFVATESNQSLLQLRSSDQDEKNIPFNAVQYISLYNTIKQFREINQTSVNNVYINFADGKIMEQAYINDLLQINYS